MTRPAFYQMFVITAFTDDIIKTLSVFFYNDKSKASVRARISNFPTIANVSAHSVVTHPRSGTAYS